MIFCESGSTSDDALDAHAVFVSQARANGLPVVVAQESLPDQLTAARQFDFSPFVTTAQPMSGDSVIVLNAHDIDASGYGRIRRLIGQSSIPCLAFGTFADRQARITATSRLAYAISREAVVIDLKNDVGLPTSEVPIFSAPVNAIKRKRPCVGIFFPDMSDAQNIAAILQLSLSRDFDIEILTDGSGKSAWVGKNGYDVPVWHLGELLPQALAARFDVCVFAGAPNAWPRFQMMFANVAGAGLPLIDSTKDRVWSSVITEVIVGPPELGNLAGWLQSNILPDLTDIRDEMQGSRLLRTLQLPQELADLLPPPRRLAKPTQSTDDTGVIFMPTNGVGLGHAKRCSLIADAMRDDARPTFAAFPSCIGMLTASGFDTIPLVGRTDQRPSHANDLLNHSRLDNALKTAVAFVFDGGYVFDGVMRAAADQGVPSVWIRRGLWQAGQNNNVALDRQKSFAKIVIPLEAFEELNTPPARMQNVVEVGPIVQRINVDAKETKSIRQQLSKALGLKGKSLVVTMLGGGVAADRRAQINAVCAHLEGRDDIMHLVVVWPTATADPSWFNYRNTRVVQSIHASTLIPMADLFISAVGYNSFHEALYAQIPTIFIPQMASYMDDQRARAQAAADRELAILVEPWAMLQLTQSIDDCLAGRGKELKQRMGTLTLPEPGMHAAAQHILEVIR